MIIIPVLDQVKMKHKTSQGHHLEVIHGLIKDQNAQFVSKSLILMIVNPMLQIVHQNLIVMI